MTFDLHGGEDADHKLTTFCGVEEIPTPMKQTLFSAVHCLLQDELSIQCTRQMRLPVIPPLSAHPLDGSTPAALDALHTGPAAWHAAYRKYGRA